MPDVTNPGLPADGSVQQAILDALPAHIALLGPTGEIITVNESWKRFAVANAFQGPAFGVGKNYLTVCETASGEGSDQASSAAAGIRSVLEGRASGFTFEYPCHSEGQKQWFMMSVAPFGRDGSDGVVVIHVNVTNRKITEVALRGREQRLSAILNTQPECVKVMSLAGKLLEINPAGLRILDANDKSEVIGQAVDGLIHPEDKNIYDELHRRASLGETNRGEFRIITLKGTVRWMESHATPLRDSGDEISSVLSISREITERKNAEEKLRRLNRLFSVSSGINEAIVRIQQPQELFDSACRIAVDQGGLAMAWVGVADEMGVLKPVAKHGPGIGYLDNVTVTIQESDPRGRGPGGKAFRSSAPAWLNNIERDIGTFASREEALKRGYQSCAAFPLRRHGKNFGIFVVYSLQTDYFAEDEIRLLNALAENISFAVEAHDHELQRLQTEAALRASETTMSIAQKIAHFGSWEIDFEGLDNVDFGSLRWSDEMFRIAGYEPGSVEVNNAFFFSLVPSEDQKLIRAAVSAALSNHTDYSVEHRFIRPDGEERVVREIAKIFYDSMGRPARMVGTAHDITDFKKAEEAYRFQAHLLEVAREAVLVRDMDDKIIFWNKGAERIYGWRAAEALNRRPEELFHLEQAAYDKATAIVLQEGKWEGEMLKQTQKGREIIVDASWTLVRGADGRPKSILAITTDITEKKKMEAQFLRAQRMESIGTLAGGIAHDLNNVLAPILMSIELLQSEVSDHGRPLLETVKSSAQRGADMVKQVLSFARGVGGQRMAINPVHILREVQKIARDTFPKNITFMLDAARDSWTVSGDPTQIHQVFMNLCVNARDAMPQGGAITVSIKNVVLDEVYAGLNRDAVAGSYLMVSVADTGIGMTAAIREQIFDPFFTTKDIGRGTGLGLATSLAIVKSHGGFISVYSEPNKGATFKVYLPAMLASAEVVDAAHAESAIPRGGGETILVVDDEESVRIIAQKTLQRFGYSVLVATNGAEALSIYVPNQSKIDLVITDMAMPIMDGVATIIALRSLNPHLRIIASSGLASNSSVAKAIGAGVQLFLAKPYTAEALLRTIHQGLHGTSEKWQSQFR